MKLARRIEALTAWQRGAQAGLPLSRCLELTRSDADRPEDRRQVEALIQKSRSGSGLGENREALAALFGEAVAGLLVGGERSGTLDQQLGTSARLLETEQALWRKLALALAYPTFLALAGLVLLPLPLVFAQGLGVALVRVYLPLGVLLTGLVGGLYLLRRLWLRGGTPRGLLEGLVLATPILGRMLRSSAASLFLATLGSTLEAGIGPGEACRASCRASGLQGLAERAEALGRSLEGGAPFSAVLPGTGAFSRRVQEALTLGEETGTLPAQLQAQAKLEQEELGRAGTHLAVALGVSVVGVVGLALVVAIVGFWSAYFSQFSDLGM